MDSLRVEIAFLNTLTVAEVDPPIGGAWLAVTFGQFTITAKGDVMYTLPVDHLVKMKVSYTDAGGNPATVDGAVAWASSDTAIAGVTVDSSDSTICTVKPVGKAGQVQITATADADIGQGVRQLITTADIDVVAGEAVAGSMQPLGEPEPIAPHPAPQRR